MKENKMFNEAKDEAVDLSEFEPARSGIIDKFLGTKSHKRRTLHKSFPGFKAALFFKAVTEVLNEYKVYATIGISRGELAAPSYSYLAVGRDKREELLVDGYRLVAKDGNRIVVLVEPGMRSMYLDIYYPEDKSDFALNFLKAVEKYMAENNFYKGEKITPAGEFLPIPNLTFDDVQLPDEQKETIKVAILDFFKKKEIYDKAKIPFKRGMILTGIPGTGKTLVGKILMNQSKCTFIWVSSDMVDYASDIKYIFDMGKELSPVIIFMEDLDEYLARSGAVDVLKTTLDGMESIDGICAVICTNYPDRLPKPLLRPGRIDDVLILQLPNENLRYRILANLAESMDIENKEQNLKILSKHTKKFTGAHLKELLIYALLLAADRGRETIAEKDLANALVKLLNNMEVVNEKIREVDIKSLIKTNRKK